MAAKCHAVSQNIEKTFLPPNIFFDSFLCTPLKLKVTGKVSLCLLHLAPILSHLEEAKESSA